MTQGSGDHVRSCFHFREDNAFRSFGSGHSPFVIWLLLVLFVCPQLATADLTSGPGEKKKKKKDDQEYLPEARPINVRFIAGTQVDIELEGVTARQGPLRFVIREQPQHGTLSAIRPHPRELFKAIVTYTPKTGDASLVDRFTYACKLEEGSWSASSPVSLIGKRANPKIEIVQPPSFGRVLPGSEGASKMVLKNTGIAPFAADIQWQAPWLGPPRIELGIGEEREFLVTVKPSAPGTLIWETELQHGEPLSRVKLYVECTQPFVVAPGQLKLNYVAATGDRRGKVGVANSTDLPMKLTIEPPARMRAPKEIEVQPKQSLDVEVSLSPDDVNVFRGELWVINEPYRERVLIDAAPEPAQAALVSPKDSVIDFGTVPKGQTAQSKVVLQNVGGEPAVLAAQAAPPFRVVESDSAVSIASGASRELVVEGLSEQAGKFTGNIIFSGSGGKLSMTAKLTVTDPSTPQPIRPMTGGNPRSVRVPVAKASGAAGVAPLAGASSRPVAPPPKPADAAKAGGAATADGAAAETGRRVPLSKVETALLGYLSTFGMPTPKELLSARLQKIERIELVRQGKDQLVLAWKEPAEKPESYRLEEGYRVRNEPTRRWLKAWHEMPNVEKIAGEAGKHTVRITKLLPGSNYEFRVLGVDKDGKVSEPSDIHRFSTGKPWRWPSWTWQALVALALVIFLFVYYRLKRGKWEI